MQGLGNTRPALMASLLRLILFVVPVYWLSHQPSFEMRHVWYLSLGSVFVHMCVLVWLVRARLSRLE